MFLVMAGFLVSRPSMSSCGVTVKTWIPGTSPDHAFWTFAPSRPS